MAMNETVDFPPFLVGHWERLKQINVTNKMNPVHVFTTFQSGYSNFTDKTKLVCIKKNYLEKIKYEKTGHYLCIL
jgi:hypothetical protein